jgi:transcriptional regulator with XRE-family HTH domain
MYPRLTVLVAELAQCDLERLAAVSGVSVRTIELLAAGEHGATPATISALAAALDRDPAELFQLVDPDIDAHWRRVGLVTDLSVLQRAQ